MKLAKTTFAGMFLVLLTGRVMAQQAGLDKAAVLKELDRLEQLHKEKVTVEQKNIKKELEKALSNTKALLELYEEAVFATKFEGGKKDSSDFRKWKNEQEDILKADDFQAALAVHVSYLYLSLLRASGETPEKINEALVQHISKVWALDIKYDLHTRANGELLDRPISQGVLARRYQLEPKLGVYHEKDGAKEIDKTWEWVPANTDGMLDRTVFPLLRKQKNPMLIPIWDKRISNDAARVKRAGLVDKSNQFTQQVLPKLHWRRARDLVLLGKEAEGFSAMIEILRQNANHAEFEKFAGELRSLLGGQALADEKEE